MRRIEQNLEFIADIKRGGFISGKIVMTKEIMKNGYFRESDLDLCCTLSVSPKPGMKHVGSWESMSLLSHVS